MEDFNAYFAPVAYFLGAILIVLGALLGVFKLAWVLFREVVSWKRMYMLLMAARSVGGVENAVKILRLKPKEPHHE